jgi:hypothetical protein
MATKGKSKKKSTKSSSPKLQDDAVGWVLAFVVGGKSKKTKSGKGKGPKFSEDALGWLIKQLTGK